MKSLYADFHVHVGEAKGRPVKIAAARSLTLPRLLEHARYVKGLDVVTVIDGVCDHVLEEIDDLFAKGELTQAQGGGLLYRGELLVILGAEVELSGPFGRAAHFGCWFPNLDAARDFNAWLKGVQRNTSLSSQLARTDAGALAKATHERRGLFVVHHAFTPFKGILGAAVDHLSEFVDTHQIDALELGLSADTAMADRIEHIRPFTFLSNSDAHGLATIAREFNRIRLNRLSFDEVAALVHKRSPGSIVLENFGLHPAHGKYYRSRCRKCGMYLDDDRQCVCGTARHHVVGVAERVSQLANGDSALHPPDRPPYRHIVPLRSIPGLGPKAYQRILDAFGTELALYEDGVTLAALADVIDRKLAERVFAALCGDVSFREGGAGRYGRMLVGEDVN
ncbi:endonuclease Q family protein [Alicyclobacillus acidiphilus]|uniref:endonuclease Q family protein n=1 Tax=Alicyclobacillus acidiphilus TaxID=182455 RepID=UPI00082B603D|nr:endonuclease Q family protein [Alicyclobacillus acidiphilus]